MKLSIFFDKDIHDQDVRHNGLDIEVSSFNYISDTGFLQFRRADGLQGHFFHVVGVIAVEPVAEAKYWSARFGGPVEVS